MQDPYSVLGVSRGASKGEIEAAYDRLAQIYHPDRYAGVGSGASEEAQRRLRELKQARAILLERQKKILRPRTVRVTMSRRDLVLALVLLATMVLIVIGLVTSLGD